MTTSNTRTPKGRQPLQYYRARLGVDTVFLPVPWRMKGPRFKGWPKTKLADTRDPSYERDCETDNLGVLTGPVSDHLVSIDFDEQSAWDLMVPLNPLFAQTFQTKGVRPGAIHIRLKGEYPIGHFKLKWQANPQTNKEPVEWRVTNICQMIAGLHENGLTLYTVLNEHPVLELRYEDIVWPGELMRPDESEPIEPPYQPTGGSPFDYLQRGICYDDILLGNGFLERGCAGVLHGLSGIGKSSIAMQMGCCFSAKAPGFNLDPARALRVMMVQNEDSRNDLVRQSEVTRNLGLSHKLIHANFHIETVRGKIGKDAIKIFYDLVRWFKADMLILNPLSAYHEGDIVQNRDNISFLYGNLAALMDELRIGVFALHHKTKPPKKPGQNNGQQDLYSAMMYDMLAGSAATNFFRFNIGVAQIGNSGVFKFTCNKRFQESEWPFQTMMWKWDADPAKRLWVPASFAAGTAAKSGKTLDDLRKLVPVTGSIPKETLEMDAVAAGIVRSEFRGLLAKALDESTPDQDRLYQWSVYNPKGRAGVAISRFEQPKGESHQEVKERLAKERKSAAAAATWPFPYPWRLPPPRLSPWAVNAVAATGLPKPKPRNPNLCHSSCT